MPNPWPHAPPHCFDSAGLYFITAGTLHKQLLFNSEKKLDLMEENTRVLIEAYKLIPLAWAFFGNHYHLMLDSSTNPEAFPGFIGHLHRHLARELNLHDGTPGRKVFYNFWDTKLTWQKSALARLGYTHYNPVHHGLVKKGAEYKWCSAAHFESTASRAFCRTVQSFKIDRLKIPDDF